MVILSLKQKVPNGCKRNRIYFASKLPQVYVWTFPSTTTMHEIGKVLALRPLFQHYEHSTRYLSFKPNVLIIKILY